MLSLNSFVQLSFVVAQALRGIHAIPVLDQEDRPSRPCIINDYDGKITKGPTCVYPKVSYPGPVYHVDCFDAHHTFLGEVAYVSGDTNAHNPLDPKNYIREDTGVRTTPHQRSNSRAVYFAVSFDCTRQGGRELVFSSPTFYSPAQPENGQGFASVPFPHVNGCSEENMVFHSMIVPQGMKCA